MAGSRIKIGFDFYQLTEESNPGRLGEKRKRYLCAGLKQKQLKLEGSWFESFSNISWYKREEELPFESLIVIFVPSILCVIWAGTIWALPERIV